MILEAIGEIPTGKGKGHTPRVASMYEEIFYGMEIDPRELLQVSFTEYHMNCTGKRYPLYSMCSITFYLFTVKRTLPIYPRRKSSGHQQDCRVTEVYARRPQLQERLTSQIADCIYETLKPHGVAVIIEAEHMCMTRESQQTRSHTITSAVRGIFETRAQTRNELLSLIMKK